MTRLVAVNAEGSHFATLGTDAKGLNPGLTLFEASSGDAVATAPAPVPAGASQSFTLLHPNSDRTQLYASFRYVWRRSGLPDSESGKTVVFRFSDLQPIATVVESRFPALRPTHLVSLAFSPDGTSAIGGQLGPGLDGLLRINPRTLVAEYVDIDTVGAPYVAIAAPPLAPTDLGARVPGRAVSLSWTLPAHSAAATQFRIEARDCRRVVLSLQH